MVDDDILNARVHNRKLPGHYQACKLEDVLEFAQFALQKEVFENDDRRTYLQSELQGAAIVLVSRVSLGIFPDGLGGTTHDVHFEFGLPLKNAIQVPKRDVVSEIIARHELGPDDSHAFLLQFYKATPGKGDSKKVDSVIKDIIRELDTRKARSITRCAQMSVAASDPKPGTKKMEYNFKPPLSSHRITKDRYQAVLNFVPAIQNFNYLPVHTSKGNFLLAEQSRVVKLFQPSTVAMPTSGFMHEDKHFVHNLWRYGRGGFQLYSFNITFRKNNGGGCHAAYLK